MDSEHLFLSGDKIGGSHEGMLENVQPLHMKWIQIEMFNLSIQMDPKNTNIVS